jgi:DNA-binding transcriptional LysR family regulator
MPNLNSLALFAAVINAKSFSRAAQLLKMPTSTLSRRITDLEKELGARLLERSTRRLRPTDLGARVLSLAHQSADIAQEVASIATDHTSGTTGVLRLSAPPSISDSLLSPLLCGFLTEFPGISVQILITERIFDLIEDGVDLAFRVGAKLQDSSVVARRVLTYRHQLVASPTYLEKFGAPKAPDELLAHRLLAFSFWKPRNIWRLFHINGKDHRVLQFQPLLAINEYAGLATALVHGAGVGELPPIVQPDLIRTGKLGTAFDFSFFCPIFLGHQKASGYCSQDERLLYGRGPLVLREEPGKQKARRRRAQELSRSGAQENGAEKGSGDLNQ